MRNLIKSLIKKRAKFSKIQKELRFAKLYYYVLSNHNLLFEKSQSRTPWCIFYLLCLVYKWFIWMYMRCWRSLILSCVGPSSWRSFHKVCVIASPAFSIMIALRILVAIVTSDDVVEAVVTPPVSIDLMKAKIMFVLFLPKSNICNMFGSWHQLELVNSR